MATSERIAFKLWEYIIKALSPQISNIRDSCKSSDTANLSIRLDSCPQKLRIHIRLRRIG
jgi:hypothetical protein